MTPKKEEENSASRDTKKVEESPRHFLVVGYSQNGKSSFTNFFVQDAQSKGKVGTPGQGLCCTQSINFYNCSHPDLFNDERVVFVDTIGLGDTLLKSKKEIQTAIVQNLTVSGAPKLDGIIIVEAVTNSTITLPKVTAFLIEMFGPTVTQSTIVLATKTNAVVVEEELKERLAELENLQKKLSLAGLLIFTTPYQYLECSAIENFNTQTKNLGKKLGVIPHLDLTTITQNPRQKLEERANEIRNAGKKDEIVHYTVDKVRHENRTREHMVEFTEWILFVPIKRSQIVQETYTAAIVYQETLSKTVTVYPAMEECLTKAKEEMKSSIKFTLLSALGCLFYHGNPDHILWIYHRSARRINPHLCDFYDFDCPCDNKKPIKWYDPNVQQAYICLGHPTEAAKKDEVNAEN